MEHKTNLLLLLLLLLLVFAATSDGAPTSRGLRMFNDKELAYDLHPIDQEIIVGGEKDIEESYIYGINIERRMELETMDYPGAGANNGHSPKKP